MQQQTLAVSSARSWPDRWQIGVAFFLIMLTLALLSRRAFAEGEGGTLPPGGTVPPPPPTDVTRGFVRVVHAAPFAPVVADTAVDICDATNTPVSGLSGLVYLSATDYLPFAPGFYDWYVGEPGCTAQVVDIPEFRLFPDTVVSLYILGDNDNQPVTTILNVDRAGLNRTYHLPIVFQQTDIP